MNTYEVLVTWTMRGTNTAAMLGHDSRVLVSAESPTDACREQAHAHAHYHDDDWETNKYDITAECVHHGIVYVMTEDF